MEVIVVPKALREKLGDEGADSLVDLINRANNRVKEDTLVFVEEKFEKRITEEISKVYERMSEFKADIIRWMSIFWVGQIGVLVAFLLAFFK